MRRPPRYTRSVTLFPYPTLFRSARNLPRWRRITLDRPERPMDHSEHEMTNRTDTDVTTTDVNDVIAELDRMNVEAAEKHLWIRTKWNLPNQKPWHLGQAGAPSRGPNNLQIGRAHV